MKSLILTAGAGLVALTVGVASASNPSQEAVEAAAKDSVGSISGKVTWTGDRPEPKADITMGEKESVGCVHHQGGPDTADRSLLISDKGGVANVVFTVEVDGMKPKIPAEPIVLDQSGCRFEPHVQVLPVGATIRYDNSDETNHNIHTYAKKNQAVNKNVAGGTNFEQVLEKAESIDVKCDIHPWMKGYVVVTDATHWGISGPDGSFNIDGLPPGTYTVEWWHEELGKGKTEKVTVEAGKAATLAHEVGEAKKSSGKKRRR